jgi:hypothetical protein
MFPKTVRPGFSLANAMRDLDFQDPIAKFQDSFIAIQLRLGLGTQSNCRDIMNFYYLYS